VRPAFQLHDPTEPSSFRHQQYATTSSGLNTACSGLHPHFEPSTGFSNSQHAPSPPTQHTHRAQPSLYQDQPVVTGSYEPQISVHMHDHNGNCILKHQQPIADALYRPMHHTFLPKSVSARTCCGCPSTQPFSAPDPASTMRTSHSGQQPHESEGSQPSLSSDDQCHRSPQPQHGMSVQVPVNHKST
jgi:hypothetical protein